MTPQRNYSVADLGFVVGALRGTRRFLARFPFSTITVREVLMSHMYELLLVTCHWVGLQYLYTLFHIYLFLLLAFLIFLLSTRRNSSNS